MLCPESYLLTKYRQNSLKNLIYHGYSWLMQSFTDFFKLFITILKLPLSE